MDKSKNTDAQLKTLPQFPFEHMLPVIPPGGLSASQLRILSETLRNAVAAKGIPFGRRKPNNSNDIGLLKFLSPGQKSAKKGGSLKKPKLSIDWLDRLSTSDERIFAEIVPNDILEIAKTQSGGKSSDRIIDDRFLFLTALSALGRWCPLRQTPS